MSSFRKNSRGSITIGLIVLLIACFALSWSKSSLRERQASAAQTELPPLYLPQADTVKTITLGFNNFFSDVLWFNTINYFGKQYLGTQDFKWFSHMCDIVNQLDPKAEHVYEFCGSLLSWVAKEPEESNKILTRAIENIPNSWRFLYLRGFNYWYFMEDKKSAEQDFLAASKKSDAPVFLASIASRLMVDTGDDPETAKRFLKDLIKNSKDETARQALRDKLKRAQISSDKKRLGDLIAWHEETYGKKPESLEDLVKLGKLRFVPKDPFGGTYFINKDNGSIDSTSGEKGLEFFGKTAKTGAMRHEFE